MITVLGIVLLCLLIVGIITAIVLGSVAVWTTSHTTSNMNAVTLTGTQTLTAPSISHLHPTSAAPSVVTAGTVVSAVSLSAESTDTSGVIIGTITAFSLPQAQTITVTFSTPFAVKPGAVILTNLKDNSYVFSWSTTNFIIVQNYTTSFAQAGTNMVL